ncbi:MAG: BatA domain-containing protein [Phycisphaerales bacterium]|nr:BatA domain-containing protein [Phycisphaerales bacterium]
MLIDLVSNQIGVGFIISTPLMAFAGALAILVPLLIHLLFRRRRRPVEWAAMQFVIQAWAARRRRVRMEQWILLTLRCLVPLVLGFALAQPLLADGNWFSGSTHHYIIIDNGVSTTTTSTNGQTDFEQLKEQASDFIRSGNPGDLVTIVSSTNPLKTPRSTGDLEQAALHVESMGSRFIESDLKKSLDKVIGVISNGTSGGRNEVTIFSPFRSGSLGKMKEYELEPPSGSVLQFSTPTITNLENTRFESVEPLRRFILRDKNETESGRSSLGRTAMASLVRDGAELPSKQTSISTSLNGKTTHRTYQWKTGQERAEVELQLPIDSASDESATIKVTIDDVDANMNDNSWYLTMDTVEQLRFLILDRVGDESIDSNQSRWIKFALNPGDLESLETRVMDPMAIIDSDLDQLDVLVITRPDLLQEMSIELVGEFLEENGIVILLPPADREIHHWTTSLQRNLGLPWSWGKETRTFIEPVGIEETDVAGQYLAPIAGDLPVLLESIRVQKSMELVPSTGADILLTIGDGSPLLVVSAHGDDNPGTVIHITTPMDPTWTDLPTKPLMVPLFQELVRNSLSNQRMNRQRFVGDVFEVPGSTLVGGDGHRIPVDIDTNETVSTPQHPGHWVIENKMSESVGTVSVNIRAGSTNTGVTDVSEIPTLLGEPEHWIELAQDGYGNRKTAGPGGSLTRALLLFLLALIVAETILSRLFTHTTTQSNPGSHM